MGYSQYDPAVEGRTPWNAAKKVGTKRPLTQKQSGTSASFWIAKAHRRKVGRSRPNLAAERRPWLPHLTPRRAG